MKKSRVKKIGVLGGAFNPPHWGHLLLASDAVKKAGLDQIIFMPCGLPALRKKDLAPDKDRFLMAKILIKSLPAGRQELKKIKLSSYEIEKGKRGKKSYTYETIKHLKRKYPGSKIYWILGEDSFREMVEGKWKYDGLTMLKTAQFMVASRRTHPYNLKTLPKRFDKRLKKFLQKIIWLDFNLPISATQIRKEIREGKKRNKYLPLKIYRYILKKRLYAPQERFFH